MTSPEPASPAAADPSRVIASLARDQVTLELKTVDLCFLAALYLRADKAALAHRMQEVFPSGVRKVYIITILRTTDVVGIATGGRHCLTSTRVKSRRVAFRMATRRKTPAPFLSSSALRVSPKSETPRSANVVTGCARLCAARVRPAVSISSPRSDESRVRRRAVNAAAAPTTLPLATCPTLITGRSRTCPLVTSDPAVNSSRRSVAQAVTHA